MAARISPGPDNSGICCNHRFQRSPEEKHRRHRFGCYPVCSESDVVQACIGFDLLRLVLLLKPHTRLPRAAGETDPVP